MRYDALDFLSAEDIQSILSEAFQIVTESRDSFNLSETFSGGYYNHVTIVDLDEDGKSFSKTLKLSKLGAGHLSVGHAALHVLAALYVLSNKEDLVEDFNEEAYIIALADALKSIRNCGVSSAA